MGANVNQPARDAFTMTRYADGSDAADSPVVDPAFPPVVDGDPAEHLPLPLDDMPVPSLTEPTDVNGG
jgi:hypothetical protein